MKPATGVDGRPDQEGLGIVDTTVSRNAYGRQLDSFEADLELTMRGVARFPGVFIRAPLVDEAGAATVLARFLGPAGGSASRQRGRAVLPSELSEDLRLHREFVELARSTKVGFQHNTGR